MRIGHLIGLDPTEAHELIWEECPSVLFKDVVRKPEDMAGKAVVFITGLANGKLKLRSFSYITEGNEWTVADINTHDGTKTSVKEVYKEEYIGLEFGEFYHTIGFIMDADENA